MHGESIYKRKRRHCCLESRRMRTTLDDVDELALLEIVSYLSSTDALSAFIGLDDR